MLEKWKRDQKELSKKKYTHIELEKKYKKKVLIPSLERKKEELRKKREYFQPIKRKDFIDHQKQYEERLKYKMKEKNEKREKWYKDIGYGDYDSKKYESKFLENVLMEDNMPTHDPKIDILEQRDKKVNYAKFVREMHKPTISNQK